MDGNNLNSPTGVNTVWIDNNPYLVTESGIIPLTTNLSGLSLTSTSLPFASPPSGGEFYVVSVKESPTRDSLKPETNGNIGETNSVITGVNQDVNITNNNYNKPQEILNQDISTNQPLQHISQQINSGFKNSQLYFNPGNSLNSLQLPVNQVPHPANQHEFFTNTPQSLRSHTLSTSQPHLPTSNSHILPTTTPQSLINSSLSISQPVFSVDQFPTSGRMMGLPGQPYTAALFSGLPLPSNSSSLSTGFHSNSSLPSPSLSSSSMSVLSDSSSGNVTTIDGTLNCVYSSSDTLTSAPPVPPTPSLVSMDKGDPPEVSKPTYAAVKPRYDRPLNKECCVRCEKKVYHMEKLGPVKDCLYHKLCFSCVVCGMILNIKNYFVNPNDLDDINVYCITHAPSNKSVCVDAASVSIKGALKAPKLDIINEQIRGGPDARKGNKIDSKSLSVKTALNAPRPSLEGEHIKYHDYSYNIDS